MINGLEKQLIKMPEIMKKKTIQEEIEEVLKKMIEKGEMFLDKYKDINKIIKKMRENGEEYLKKNTEYWENIKGKEEYPNY